MWANLTNEARFIMKPGDIIHVVINYTMDTTEYGNGYIYTVKTDLVAIDTNIYFIAKSNKNNFIYDLYDDMVIDLS